MNIALRIAICLALAIVAALVLQQITSPSTLLTIAVITLASVISLFLGEWVLGNDNSSKSKKPAKATRKASSSSRETGKVKWFNYSKGYGFITRDNGEDLFVHFRSIQGTGRRVLNEGQSVEFSVSEGEKGLQADEVEPLE